MLTISSEAMERISYYENLFNHRNLSPKGDIRLVIWKLAQRWDAFEIHNDIDVRIFEDTSAPGCDFTFQIVGTRSLYGGIVMHSEWVRNMFKTGNPDYSLLMNPELDVEWGIHT